MNVYVSESSLVNRKPKKGLFASKNFIQGEIVYVHTVKKDFDKLLQNLHKEEGLPNDILIEESIPNMVNNLRTGKELFDCHPNLKVNVEMRSTLSDSLVFMATREIVVGDELYVHYGLKYWINQYIKMLSFSKIKYGFDFIKIIMDDPNNELIHFPRNLSGLSKKSIQLYVNKFFGDEWVYDINYNKIRIHNQRGNYNLFNFNNLFFYKEYVGKCDSILRYTRNDNFKEYVIKRNYDELAKYLVNDFCENIQKVDCCMICGVDVYSFCGVSFQDFTNFLIAINYSPDNFISDLRKNIDIDQINDDCVLMLCKYLCFIEEISGSHKKFVLRLLDKLSTKNLNILSDFINKK